MTREDFGAATQRMAAAIHSSSHAGLSWEHVRYALVWEAQLWGWYFFWILGRFLLGYVAGKNWNHVSKDFHAAQTPTIAVVVVLIVVAVVLRVRSMRRHNAN